MPDWISGALTTLQPLWPFFVKVITFWFVGQNIKRRVLTKKRAASSAGWALMRDTMWAHPMVVGILWGAMYPWMPAVDWVSTRGGAITEGILAGVMSTIGFLVLEAVAKKQGWTAITEVIHEVEDGSIPPTPPAPSEEPKE